MVKRTKATLIDVAAAVFGTSSDGRGERVAAFVALLTFGDDDDLRLQDATDASRVFARTLRRRQVAHVRSLGRRHGRNADL